MSLTRLRAARGLAKHIRASQRTLSTTARLFDDSKAVAPATNDRPTSASDTPLPKVYTQVPIDVPQAPNRVGIWSRSQEPRDKAMVGPRFEQTDFDLQPQPYSAMELVHKQPVRWTHDRVVACDGGGGATGHPKIFINTDKPEISVCNYCGLPYANEHHREHLESLPQTSYPLDDLEGLGATPPLARPEPPH